MGKCTDVVIYSDKTVHLGPENETTFLGRFPGSETKVGPEEGVGAFPGHCCPRGKQEGFPSAQRPQVRTGKALGGTGQGRPHLLHRAPLCLTSVHTLLPALVQCQGCQGRGLVSPSSGLTCACL